MLKGIKARLVFYVGLTLLLLFAATTVITQIIQEKALDELLGGAKKIVESTANEQVKSNQEAVAIKAAGIAKMLAAMAPDAVVSLSLSNLLTFTKVATDDPDISSVTFLDAKNKKLASSNDGSRTDNNVRIPISYQSEVLGSVIVGYNYSRAAIQNADTRRDNELNLAAMTDSKNSSLRHAGLSQFTMSVLVIIGAVIILYLITLGITRPLQVMVLAMSQIAQGNGDLTQRLHIRGRDEIAQLADAFNRFITKIESLVKHVKRAAFSVAETTKIIVDGNSSLSQRTQSQGASLEETAASIEEITSTVKQNADNTDAANQLATQALNNARDGGKVVGRAISAISEISESSKRIREIIAVIEKIVFQSNLLSLNAAVEAAHAGEQGRGFAVVATEMKNLARRVSEASREIKTLIADSAKKVDAGAKLANESGVTLGKIVNSSEQLSAIIRDIATASKEQAAGIDQISTVISDIDGITQKNSILVEDTVAVSTRLADQSEGVIVLVNAFKISEDTGKPVMDLVGVEPAAA